MIWLFASLFAVAWVIVLLVTFWPEGKGDDEP